MRRWALRIFVLLLLGAIVNVAVAWGIASWVPLVQPKPVSRNGVESRQASYLLQSYVPDRAEWLVNVQTSETAGLGATVIALTAMDHHPDTPNVPIEDGVVYSVVEGRLGVPFRSLMWACRFDRPITQGKGTLQLFGAAKPDLPWLGVHRGELIPIRLIWPGFAINTVFFAAILWGLFAVPFALRRRRRIKRGLCPTCAYDLRGAATEICPECGATTIR